MVFINNSKVSAIGMAFAWLHSKFSKKQFMAETAYKTADGFVFFYSGRPKIDSKNEIKKAV
ncbi:MAG: hypothetical protein WCH99_02295 [Verrucomicrobiota bacterium]